MAEESGQQTTQELLPTTKLKPGSSPGLTGWIPLLLLAPALLLLAGLLPTLAGNWRTQRSYQFQLDAEEGFILNQAVELAHGRAIYHPVDRPPFVVGNYTPLFPAVYALVNGGQATPASLPDGRLMVELAALGTALGLGVIIALRHRRLPLMPRACITLFAFLVFLVTYEVFHWSAFVRVDFPALLLTVAGLGVFLLARARWGAALAGGLFVAAICTRQTAILAPLACALALLLHDRRRLFIWFLQALLVCGLVPLLWLEWRTGGEFLRHTFTYNQNRMDWTGWRRLMNNEVWFFYRWWILALVALGAARLMGKGRSAERGARSAECGVQNAEFRMQNAGSNTRNDEAPRTPGNFRQADGLSHTRHAVGIYGLLGMLSLLSYAKVGAAPNYVLEPLLAAALWGADSLGILMLMGRTKEHEGEDAGLKRSPRSGIGLAWRVAGRALLWGGCLLVLLHAGRLWGLGHQFPWSPMPRPPDRAAAHAALVEARQAAGSDIYSEEPIFTMLAGKPVLFQPFIMTQLAREGRWDETPFLKMLDEKRFGLLIVTEDLAQGVTQNLAPGLTQRVPEPYYERYTPAMAAAVRRNYAPAERLALPTLGKTYYLWRLR